MLPPLTEKLAGYDISAKALPLARAAAKGAGVFDDIHFQQRPVAEFSTSRKYGCAIVNPPYGERLGERAEAEALYRDLGSKLGVLDTWSIYVLTSHPRFEACFGRSASRKRKLFNGRIECVYYQYQGPKPPRSGDDAAALPLPPVEGA